MKEIRDTLGRVWHKLPASWRKKALVWIATLAVSRLVIMIWGTEIFIAGLLLFSFAGAFLRSWGLRSARHADALFGKVWDYFRGAILVALLPALWPAIQMLRERDFTSALIQVLVIGLIAAIVFEQFNRLPRTWSTMSRQKSAERTARRRSRY